MGSHGDEVSVQQKRNKAVPRRTTKADGSLQLEWGALAADVDPDELWIAQTAIDVVELRISQLVAKGMDTPFMPPAAWAQLIKAARAGQGKGLGRGRPFDSNWHERDRAQKEITLWGRKLRDELINAFHVQQAELARKKKKIQPVGVEDSIPEQAAKAASDWGYEHYRIRYAANTIKKWIQSRT